MEIRQTKEETALTIALSGRLDTNTSPELERHLVANLGIRMIRAAMIGMEYHTAVGLNNVVVELRP